MGSRVTPLINALSNAMTGFNRAGSLNLQLSRNTYPGDRRCNRRQAHSKWHEISVNGLVDIALTAKNMNRILAGGSLSQSLPTSVTSVVQCFENGWKAQSDASDVDLFSSDAQDKLLGGVVEECAAPNLFDYGNFLSCFTGKVVQLSKSTMKSTPLEQCLIDHACITLKGSELDANRFHDCLLGEENASCKSYVSSTTIANLEACLIDCSADYLCAMTCLQGDFSPWFDQTVSCATVLSSTNPSSAAVSNCQKPLAGETDTATAFLTLLKRFASTSQSACSKEHETVLRNFASSQKCFQEGSKSDDEIPLDFVCVIRCMALS